MTELKKYNLILLNTKKYIAYSMFITGLTFSNSVYFNNITKINFDCDIFKIELVDCMFGC